MKLNKIDRNMIEIIEFLRPSKLNDTNIDELINNLYDEKIIDNDYDDATIKKYCVNSITGLLEKSKNKRIYASIYLNHNEAIFNQIKLGGTIKTIMSENDNKMYIHEVKRENKLINGFKNVKELIYDMQKLTMYELFVKCNKANLHPIGMRTDCIIVTDDEEQLKRICKNGFNIGSKIGQYKISVTECPTNMIVFNENNIMYKKKVLYNKMILNDEYDINEITEKINNKNCMINAILPGSGKTYLVKSYASHTNKKVLFVTPFNKLSQELKKDGCESVTLNVLLGKFGGGDSIENVKMSACDITEYNIICFDEIMIYNVYELYLIKMYMNNHSEKQFLGTGDLNQLKPIGIDLYNNIKDQKQFLTKCHNTLFSNIIELQHNKRLKNEEDKIKLSNLKNEVLYDTKTDIIDILKKYDIKIINQFSAINTINNVAFFNYRVQQINTHVHTKVVKIPKTHYLINDIKMYVGLEIVNKKHWKAGSIKFHVNYNYVIMQIEDVKQTVRLQDVNDPLFEVIINYEQLKNFQLSYCNTAHAVQGLSIKNKMTVFDVNSPYVDRQFIWTAITRCTDLKNLQIFEHSEKTTMQQSNTLLMRYLNNKITNYKQQDVKAKRDFDDENFVDIVQIKELFKNNKCCPMCYQRYELGVESYNVHCTFTVDRLNNDFAHTKDNVRLACIDCNRKRSNNYNLD